MQTVADISINGIITNGAVEAGIAEAFINVDAARGAGKTWVQTHRQGHDKVIHNRYKHGKHTLSKL